MSTRRAGALIAALLLAATVGAGSAAALPRSASITTAGLGAIRIGMTEREVEQAGRRAITRRGGTGDCSTATLGDRLVGLFTGTRLARISVAGRRYATRSGIRVGDTEAEVLATYPGRLVREPHKYTAGSYLKFTDGDRRVVFETDGQRVTQISTGRRPEIDYVEGCA